MPALVSVFGVKPFRIGGTETFARELSVQLGKLGWKSVLCFESEPSEEVRSFLSLPNVSIEVMEDISLANWSAMKALISICRKYRPELLHLHFTGFISPYPWLVRLLGVRRIFFTDHSSRPSGYVKHEATWWKKAIVRIINRPLTRVISVSRYGYECLTALDVLPRDRFVLVYNAVDLSRVSDDITLGDKFREKHHIPRDRTVVLQVSWIIPEKGIADLIKAASLVVSKDNSVHFVLVGEGDYRAQYMEDAKELGLANNITWTGLVADPFGEGAFHAADIICQVSRWEEVFGWMITEGMAHSKPIIATRVGGIPELVTDGENGYLVERGDSPSMAKRILQLVGNLEWASKMGLVGKRRTESLFNLTQNVGNLIDEYKIERIR